MNLALSRKQFCVAIRCLLYNLFKDARMTLFQDQLKPCLGAASLMGFLNIPRSKADHHPHPRSEFRQFVRVPGFFHVDLWVNGTHYKSITHNISYGGMFIETGPRFSVGQRIVLCILVAHQLGHFHVNGTIVRNSPHGIGVKLLRE